MIFSLLEGEQYFGRSRPTFFEYTEGPVIDTAT
jgi:hypothetical protein